MLKNMNSLFFIVMTLFSLLAFSLPALSAEKLDSEDKVAAINGSIITVNDFNREMNLVKERLLHMGTSVSDSQLPELKNKVLENLINLEVLYQESQKAGIKVDEKIADNKFESIKKSFPNEAELNEWLNKMNTSEADIKNQILQQMAIHELIKTQVEANIIITDEETKAYYDSHPEISKQPENVRASHILIKVDQNADEAQKAEARKKIEEIEKKLKKGENFADVAKELSECPSASKGGDLGYFTRGRMVKPFEDAAFALKPGEISSIVETQFGYHLIKSIEKKAETTASYEDTKKNVEAILKREKLKNDATLFIDKLKEKAKIEVFLTADKL